MMRCRRVLRMLLCGSGGVITGVLIIAVAGAQQGPRPGTQVIDRKAQPSCAESIRELKLEADATKVACRQVNAPATSQTPSQYGPYRIVPAGYVGQLTARELPLPANLGESTNDLAKLQRSSLFAEPAYLPPGYQRTVVDTFDGTSELVIHLQFIGPKGPIDLFRTRQTKEALDVYAPSAADEVELQQTTIKGDMALVIAPKPGTTAEKANAVTVLFFRNGVNTTVQTHGLGVQEAFKIAESIL